MRLLGRLLLVAAVAALPAAIALASCGTDAEGIDACRQIEETRCDLAPTCSPGFDVQSCILFYRDECLVGLQNNTIGEPDEATVIQPCITALDEVAACASGAGSVDGGDGGCPGLGILVEMDASCPAPDGGTIEITPCNVLLNCPQVLYACAFVAGVPSADAGDGGDGGDASFGVGGGTGVTATTSTTTTTATTATGAGGATSATGTGGFIGVGGFGGHFGGG